MKSFVKKAKNILILMILCLGLLVPRSNGYAITQKQKALNAYSKYLKETTVEVVKNKKVKSSKVAFAIAYIDNDSIPELVIKIRNENTYGIYTFKNNKMERVKAIVFYSDEGNEYYGIYLEGYYLKTGTFKTGNYGNGKATRGKSVICGWDWYQLKNGSTKHKLCKSRQGDYYDYYEVTSGRIHDISHSTFAGIYKSLTKSKKLTSFKYHKNTYSNRKKYLK